tara:strand:+ start:299 stop:706 length:408 start_codon:yes stop_codon:yes gene_type:complete
MINKKFLFIILSFTIISIGWITLDYSGSEVPFVSVEDLLKNHKNFKQEKFRLGGIVQPGSIKFSDDKLIVNFNLNQGKFSLPVEHFSAAIPDLFGDSAEVIIEGKYENEILFADNLMTKCASRYEENNYVPYNGN